MGIINMKEVKFLGRAREKEKILNKIQDMGILHFIHFNTQKKNNNSNYNLSRTYKNLCKINKVQSILFKNKRFQKNRNNNKNFNLVEYILKLDKEKNKAFSRLSFLLKKMEKLRPWGVFNLKDVDFLKKIGLKPFFTIADNIMLEKIKKLNLIYKVVHRTSKFFWVFLICQKESSLFFLKLHNLKYNLAFLLKEKVFLKKRIKEIDFEIGSFYHKRFALRELKRICVDKIKYIKAEEKILLCGSLFGIRGFIPVNKMHLFSQKLYKFNVAILFYDPQKETNVPVCFKNIWLIEGFEKIIKKFSGASYFEQDFTWIVGILFILLGSLCLLDAGYSLLLVLSGLFIYRREKSYGKIFFATGFMSFIIGCLKGQYFGLIIPCLINDKVTLLFTLMNDPKTCCILSLFVGIFVIICSYIIVFFQLGFRNKSTGNLFFLFAILFFILSFYFKNLSNIFKYCYISFITLSLFFWILFPENIFGKNHKKTNIIWTIYFNFTNIIQDILSHMRLFGISLSSSILALVINKISIMVPFIFTILFLFFGHIFVYMLSLISLYIHTNRLIFLEFGNKCIYGGNNYYSPLIRSLIK